MIPATGRAHPLLPLGHALFAFAILVWSAIAPHDYGVWAFEILPATFVLLLIGLCWRRFPFTRLCCTLAVVHFAVLAVGAKYTYAEVPFDWVMNTFGLERNPFDRIGHFFQGFVPALFAREIARRCGPLRPGWILRIFVTSVALAFSGLYEILEMAMVLIWYPGAGPEWLGTQGDVWDAQWDMTLALIGAIAVQLLLSRRHETELARGFLSTEA